MGTHEGKVVLVTGGTSGIGLEAARSFASEGAKIVVAARNEARGEAVVQSLRDSGAEATFVRTDVRRTDEVERLVAQAVERYGRLDAAFNNAATESGVLHGTADFEESQFDEAVVACLRSVWLCMRSEIRQMLKQNPRGGSIVNTSSVNGLGGAPMGALYAAAKAGVLALTKSAAYEYATAGIRVNALVAGAFRTPMLERVMIAASGGSAEGRERIEAAYLERIPQGRLGDPREAAAAAVWLCSDAASYVTGHSMIVDGGMTAPYR